MRHKLKRIRTFSPGKLFIGLLLGLAGFCLPLLFHFDGLSFAGHITMGIFLMAAAFWMFEPIPIYSTSMLVIFLQVVLLSNQGPLFSKAELPETTAVPAGDQAWELPASALKGDQIFLKTAPTTYEPLDVKLISEQDNKVVVRSAALQAGQTVVSNANHRLIGYKAPSFTLFFGTLANPIIILFLGGFVLASGAVKYNLDKNLTSVLLKPFGNKPVNIVLGIMIVTAALSAFMSNTATTAMMMTVVIPIAMQAGKDDPFRIMLALSVPIAANLGGMATPIGTPPNAIVIAALNNHGMNIEFGTWMLLMVPLAALLIIVAWTGLKKIFPPMATYFTLKLEGKFNKAPKAIVLYAIFGLTVLLWVTEANHGIPSSMIAFLPIAGLTVTSVIGKEDIRALPWEVLWLVAGGIALGISMENTGMAVWMISSIKWSLFPSILLLLVFGIVAWLLSNFLSNTVAATLLIPLAVSMAVSGIAGEGFSLLISALVIGAGCNIAMLLPISTPPNAIAMSTGLIKTPQMIRIGLLIGIIGITAIVLFSLVFWPFIIN
jgi:solute carrier family 13 (sodium-dependent dicarboxylate transporter), member 2/3/5